MWYKLGLDAITLVIICGLILIGELLFDPALARDPDGKYAKLPLHDWFMTLKSEKGPCCADADGALVDDADWESKNGHYRVRIDGTWVDVPDSAVITVPNLDGRTIVWGYKVGGFGGGTYEIRCFMPGSMT